MKKIFLLLAVLIGLSLAQNTFAQVPQIQSQLTASTATTGAAINTPTTYYHQITWTLSGPAPSACTITVDTAPDGVTWTTGGAIAAQTCTTGGGSALVNIIANYVRINLSTFTGSGQIKINYTGYSGTAGGTNTICSGQVALPTSSMTTGTKYGASSSTPLTVTCTGLLTTDNIKLDFSTDPSGVTGYAPSANGTLTIVSYPTANTINIYLYNNTAGTVVPSAMTVNYRVYR